MNAPFDRAGEDVGNIVRLEHVNLLIPDQRLATLFYVVGLGLTRDPYLMVGVTNMWVNVGRSQMHLPSRRPVAQRLRGSVGLVVPDLDRVERSLAGVRRAPACQQAQAQQRRPRLCAASWCQQQEVQQSVMWWGFC